MISYRTGNLLKQTDLPVIVHQANLYNVFGAGIAAAIKQKFPWAFEADKENRLAYIESGGHEEDRLGTFSCGWNPDKDAYPQVVVNLYSQEGLSPSHTNYDSMFFALSDLRRILEKRTPFKKIGFPYMIGCGLADGIWEIVKVIIEQAFKDSDIEVVIVKLPEA